MRPAPGFRECYYRPSGANFAIHDHHVTDDRALLVRCSARQVEEEEAVATTFEGEVLARPGDWVVQDGDGDRGLSVWPPDRFADCFEEARN